MSFKGFFSIFSSGSRLVYRSGTILAILVGSQLGITPVKSESKWPKGLGGVSIQRKLFTFFYFSSCAILFIRADHFTFFGRGSHKQPSYEVLMKLPQGCRRSWRLKTELLCRGSGSQYTAMLPVQVKV